MSYDLATFVDTYVNLWNEADRSIRRQIVETIWAPDGANYTPTIEAVGHDEIIERVTRSYERYVGPGTYLFKLAQPAVEHHGAIVVRWHMIEIASDDTASTGTEFLILDADHRILSDHQFLDATA